MAEILSAWWGLLDQLVPSLGRGRAAWCKGLVAGSVLQEPAARLAPSVFLWRSASLPADALGGMGCLGVCSSSKAASGMSEATLATDQSKWA